MEEVMECGSPWCTMDYAMDHVHAMEWSMAKVHGPKVGAMEHTMGNILPWFGPRDMFVVDRIGHG